MLPEILKPVAHRKVRAVAQLENCFVSELGWIAAGRKQYFSYHEWRGILDELDSCDLTVAEFAEQKALYFANQSVL